jgi:hypothetical protein
MPLLRRISEEEQVKAKTNFHFTAPCSNRLGKEFNVEDKMRAILIARQYRFIDTRFSGFLYIGYANKIETNTANQIQESIFIV